MRRQFGTGLQPRGVALDDAGGAYLVAFVDGPWAGPPGHGRAVVLKLAADGAVLWMRRFGGDSTEPLAVSLGADATLTVAGLTGDALEVPRSAQQFDLFVGSFLR
jgi:hypothetical protein